MLLQVLLYGLGIGSLYGLIGFGFTLIFKATKVINFAQGDLVMVGGVAGLVFYGYVGLPYAVAVPTVMIIGGLVGVVCDRILRRLQEAPELTLLIATLAIGLTVRAIARAIIGSAVIPFPQVFDPQPLRFGPIIITMQNISLIVVLLVVVGLFYLFFYRTRTGLSMRATSQNRKAAWLMGVSVPKAFRLTWAIGGAIGALGGLLFAPIVMVNPDMGMLVLVPAVAAAVLGGFGSLLGVIVAGWLIGIAENILGFYFGSDLKEFVPYMVLFLVLVAKPSGLFRGTQ